MGDGAVVARGRIRVDARKAEAKLRDHMLVDLHLYACEIARVAVALGARDLAVDHDDRAVTFAFAGVLAPDVVARARDEVLGADSVEHHAIRLLGIAISAALSLERVVEVHTAGACVRFADSSESPTTARGSAPPGRVRIVVRNPLVAGALDRVFGGDLRRELDLLRAGVEGGPLALVLDGAPVAPVAESILLRVPLDDAEAVRASLDIVADGGGEIVFREHGVRLATSPLASARVGGAVLPLRLVVDAPRLPTNASRSAVRLDDRIATRVLDDAAVSFDRALVALEARVLHGHAIDPAITVHADDAALADALAAIAVAVAIAGPEAAPTKRARQLVDLPLLDGVFGGKVLSLAQVLARRPVHVYAGESPLDPALAPLLARQGMLVWRHGRPAERILDRHPQVFPADLLIAHAVAGAGRRARALEHAPVEARLDDRAWLLRQTFRHDTGRFRGLHGEIGVERSGWASRVRVFVDDRFLEEIPLPGVKLPIGIAIAWPRTLVGNLAYDAVERTHAFDAAVRHAVRVAALAIVDHAGGDAELVRLATLAWSSAPGEAGEAAENVEAFADAEVWPLASGAMASLRVLDTYASAHGRHLCTAPTRAAAAIDGRPVVVEAHARLLREILRDVKLVPYARFLGGRRSRIRVEHALAVPFERPGLAGVVLRGTGRCQLYHAGIPAGEVALDHAVASVDVILEDDGAIPSDGGGVLWRTPLALAKEEAALETLETNMRARSRENGGGKPPPAIEASVDDPLEAPLAALARRAAEPGFFLDAEACALFHDLHAAAPLRAVAALASLRLRTLGGFSTPIRLDEPRLEVVRWPLTPRAGARPADAVVIAPEGPARARFLMLLRACGIAVVDVTAELAPETPRLRPPPLPWQRPDLPPPHHDAASSPGRAPPPEPAPSFFAGIVREVRRLLEPPPEVLGTSPLTQALAENVAGLALTGRPVASVVEGTRGRPVRYEAEHRRLVVNARHPVVEKLAARPDGMTYLLLAATSEINRALAEVTDAEETAVVHALLR